MDRKLAAAVPLSGRCLHLTQCGLGRGLRPYQMASWSIQPFGHNIHGPKFGVGCCAPPPFLGGRWMLGSHLTQCCLDRGLPPYQVTSWSIEPFGHNRHGRNLGAVPFLERGLGVAWAEAYLYTKWHPNPSNRLTTIYQRYRQDRQTDIQDRQSTVR